MSLTSRERTTHWRQHITDWQASGLSGAAYCQQHQLTYHCFVYWRSKFTKGATPSPESPTPTGQAMNSFVAVQPPPQSSTISHSLGDGVDHLQLALPNGLVILNIRDTNLRTVRSLLEQL